MIPSILDVSVTNACNAACGFCSFAVGKGLAGERRFIDAKGFAHALPILHRRGIRYVNFQGGEPLLHPNIVKLVTDTAKAGMRTALITNGWLLPRKIDSLIDAGLGTLLISIDSHSLETHEKNRGLPGLGERIRRGIAAARRRGLPALASVTINRLVRFESMPGLLGDLGFDAVSFSYPRRKPFGSSSLVHSEDSELIDFKTEELVAALEAIKSLKKRFPIHNPTPSLDDVQRHTRGERGLFACVGGRKYFYLDWDLKIWRCEGWHEPYGSVFDFAGMPESRDHCTSCTLSCYRDTSVLMHAGLAFADAASAAASLRFGEAMRLVFRRTVALSLLSVAEQSRQILRLALRSRK